MGVLEQWVEQFVGSDGNVSSGWMGVAVAVLAVVLVSACLLVWGSGGKKVKNGMPPVPPGSYGWPLLGETLAYLGAAQSNRVAEFFSTRVAKYGEVFKTHLLFSPTVSVPAPEGNKFLFANENKLVQSAWPASVAKLLGPGSLATKTGDDHKKLRRIFTMFFGPEGLQNFVPRMCTLAKANLAECWDGKDQILGVLVVKDFTFAIAADLFVSVKQGDPQFRAMSDAVEDYLGGIMQMPIDLPGTVYHKARLGREAILRTLGPIIQQRQQDLKSGKSSADQDLLSVLLTTPDENGTFMSVDDIKDNILLLLFAGHDTSSITLALMFKYLYLHPECLKEVIREQKEIAQEKAGAPLTWEDTRKMKYTWRVCQETLRVQPPVQAAFRTAIQDFEYEGHAIPKGWSIMWSVGRSHYSPEFFPNPRKFDPSRFEGSGPAPYTFVPFGGGPHICLGHEFARTEVMVYLHYLVLNFTWEMVDAEETVSNNPMPSFAKKLQLRVRRRED